jgi:hypothetical protein
MSRSKEVAGAGGRGGAKEWHEREQAGGEGAGEWHEHEQGRDRSRWEG